MMFINLPVADVDVSESFFTSLGFTTDPQFSDETTRSVVVEDNIIVMLLAPEKWAQFLQGEAAPRGATEVMLALSGTSREECDDLKAKALANGGAEYGPTQDLGFMYGVSFRDPDGHCWEVAWMDPAAIEG